MHLHMLFLAPSYKHENTFLSFLCHLHILDYKIQNNILDFIIQKSGFDNSFRIMYFWHAFEKDFWII